MKIKAKFVCLGKGLFATDHTGDNDNNSFPG